MADSLALFLSHCCEVEEAFLDSRATANATEDPAKT